MSHHKQDFQKAVWSQIRRARAHLAGGLHDGRERGVGAGVALGVERVEARACLSRRVRARTLREVSTRGESAGSGQALP